MTAVLQFALIGMPPTVPSGKAASRGSFPRPVPPSGPAIILLLTKMVRVPEENRLPRGALVQGHREGPGHHPEHLRLGRAAIGRLDDAEALLERKAGTIISDDPGRR